MYGSNKLARVLAKRVDRIMKKHSGIGVKTLKLHLSTCCKKDIDTSLLAGWLQAFVKPGIVDLAVLLPDCYASEYNCPYSLLLNGDVANSRSTSVVKSLYLSSCGFHTTLADLPRVLACSWTFSRLL